MFGCILGWIKILLCLNFSVVCFDAKFNFDDSAKFRQKDVFAMDDQSESDPREVEAGKYDLNYIGLDGNIACLGKMVLAKIFLTLRLTRACFFMQPRYT